MIELAQSLADRLRVVWSCITVGVLFLCLMLSFHFMRLFVGEQRAYHKTLWRLAHLTEWFSKTGRHARTKGHAEGKKAEG